MNVRIVPTKVHGIVDYVTGPALAVAPEVLRLNGGRASALAPRVAGAGSTAYAALTDYELGARRVIPMRVHLALDALAGAALAATPWLAGSARRGVRHWLPHALVGGSEVALAFTTRTQPPRAHRLRGALDRVMPERLRGRPFVALPLAAAAIGGGWMVTRRLARRGKQPESELGPAGDTQSQ
jgi:hypothetical protein